MSFKSILVPTEPHDLMSSALETALLLARKFASRIEGFALRVPLPAAFAMGDVGAVPIIASEREIAEHEEKCRSLFDGFMQQHAHPQRGGEGALSCKWLENAPEGDHFVGSYGRVFDVIVLGRPGRDPRSPRMTTLEAALFDSGRPVLIAPPVPQAQMGTNVLVHWNGSTEQARAIAFAMPILAQASRVIVLTVEGGAAVPGPTAEQLCDYLRLHAVPAKLLTVGLDGRLTGEAVLAHAKALGCDLLIKGAYTQSRLRQLIFGGTTRYILSNAELPVLMAH
ncbi:MAG TPA: universal stress protein [Xanthobacteraceae bacterium]|jgi:nucleotide-binding universal stress UspA family protein